MIILLTNDDGIEAPGLVALYKATRELGEVHVAAPSKVRSACGHAVTFHRPLEAWTVSVTDDEGEPLFDGTAVYGMPADCVKLGRSKLVPGPVDVVISGINAGCNVGVHTLYSGTVAAAREAAMAGISAISMSLFLRNRNEIRWDRASEIAHDCLASILSKPLPAGTFLNVNIPILDDGAEPKGVRVVPALLSAMVDDYQGEPDADGHGVYKVGRGVAFGEVYEGSDARSLFDGYITITPMMFDPTDHPALDLWRSRLESDECDEEPET